MGETQQLTEPHLKELNSVSFHMHLAENRSRELIAGVPYLIRQRGDVTELHWEQQLCTLPIGCDVTNPLNACPGVHLTSPKGFAGSSTHNEPNHISGRPGKCTSNGQVRVARLSLTHDYKEATG